MPAWRSCFSPPRWRSRFFTSYGWQKGPQIVEDSGWPSLRSLAVTASVLTLAQVALGAGFRHRAFGIMPHIVGAIIVAMFLLGRDVRYCAVSQACSVIEGCLDADRDYGEFRSV